MKDASSEKCSASGQLIFPHKLSVQKPRNPQSLTVARSDYVDDPRNYFCVHINYLLSAVFLITHPHHNTKTNISVCKKSHRHHRVFLALY